MHRHELFNVGPFAAAPSRQTIFACNLETMNDIALIIIIFGSWSSLSGAEPCKKAVEFEGIWEIRCSDRADSQFQTLSLVIRNYGPTAR